MTRQLSHQTIPIYVALLFMLFSHNLCACPLPANLSCSECEVQRYIQQSHNSQLNINITVGLNLALSQNTHYEFARFINSINNDDFSFDSTPLSGPVTTCYGNDFEAGSPCTHSIQMVGGSLPRCTWNYTCEYSPRRFPQYLWKAQCATPPQGYRAQEIFYEVPTLTLDSMTETSCLPFQGPEAVYRWDIERVPVACSCIPITN